MNAGPEGAPRTPYGGAQEPVREHTTEERLRETAAAGEERLREAAAVGEERLREAGEEARVLAERTLHQVREYTKQNPLAAAGIAFAAGVVFSRLFSR